MKHSLSTLAVFACLLIPGILIGENPASNPDRTGAALQEETVLQQAAASPATTAAQAAVPRLIMFSGTLRDLSGKPISGPVDVTFALYSEETDGTALWFETQTLRADGLGHYNVMLGSMSPAGVPMELFTSGRAHWLGVQVSNLPEQSRVLLVSVPYAMKAGDAETLGGKPASAYQLSSQAATDAAVAGAAAGSLSGLITKGATTTTTSESALTNAITASYIPVYTDGAGTTANSILFQSGTKIGINTNTPGFNLDLNGNVFMVGTKTAAPGNGGTMRFRDDTGTQRWLFGIPGSGGSQDFFMYNYTNGRAPIFIQNGAASYSLYLNGSGNVGIGTTSPAHKLDVAGDINASGNVATSGIFTGNGSGLSSVVAASATTASSLSCSGCVGSTQLGVNYAGSSSKGGAATSAVSATNALSLGGVLAANYARRDAANTFTADQTINGNLTVSTDQIVEGNMNLTGTLNGWVITPFTSSSCTVFSSSYTSCVSGNVLGGYTGLGGKSNAVSIVNGKTILASVNGGNTIATGVIGGTVSGGGGTLDGESYANKVTNNWATVSGGALNTAGDTYAPDAAEAGCCQSVGGGAVNWAAGFGSTVAGGGFNGAAGALSIIGGGAFNIAMDIATTVGGGQYNTAGNTVTPGNGGGATVAGGDHNTASGFDATIAGGYTNTASGDYTTIAGGYTNTASGNYSTIPGGYQNQATAEDSFAAGCLAQAQNEGSFVWAGHGAGSSCYTVTTSAPGQFLALAPGGVAFYSNTAKSAGVTLAAGASAWSTVSDRNAKENFQAPDGEALLSHLLQIPILTWNYKAQDKSIRHIGPMAQDFYAAFQVGEDNKHIATIDADGVALAGVQALYQLNLEKEERIRSLERTVAEKAEQIQTMTREIEQLRKAQEQMAMAVAMLDSRIRGNDNALAADLQQ